MDLTFFYDIIANKILQSGVLHADILIVWGYFPLMDIS